MSKKNPNREHILVCLSSSPSNPTIIHTAARMASAFHASFTALFVETPDFESMSEENKSRLKENMETARKAGAALEKIYGDDVPVLIAEYARLSGVTKIVIGRSGTPKMKLFSKPTLTERLIAEAPNVDMHIIPDAATAGHKYHAPKRKVKVTSGDVWKSIGILAGATLLGNLFYIWGFTEVNIITLYLLGVLLTAVATANQVCSLLSAALSVLIFNYFFTFPRFTLRFYDEDYIVTFVVMFLSAFIVASLAIRLKNNAKQSAQTAYRTKILLEANQKLQQAKNSVDIVSITAEQLIRLLKCDVAVYLYEKDGKETPFYFSKDGAAIGKKEMPKQERLLIRVNDKVYGSVAVESKEEPEAFENSIILSILGECALALENERNAKEKEEAAIMAKNEQLRANILRAISHDLRTPLTSISGNASNLMTNSASFSEEDKALVYKDIYEDSIWLISLVENLLAISRLEDGRMHLNLSSELVSDVVAEAIRHANRKQEQFRIRIDHEDEFLLAKMDARLIIQVIINILDNAMRHAPSDSEIRIHTERDGDMARISIMDEGDGVPDQRKSQVFEMFYSGTNPIADSRRSLGLGLYLCRSIVTAHGGTIEVRDHVPRGANFTFTLPVEEVDLYE